jgi:hypothetical protein
MTRNKVETSVKTALTSANDKRNKPVAPQSTQLNHTKGYPMNRVFPGRAYPDNTCMLTIYQTDLMPEICPGDHVVVEFDPKGVQDGDYVVTGQRNRGQIALLRPGSGLIRKMIVARVVEIRRCIGPGGQEES